MESSAEQENHSMLRIGVGYAFHLHVTTYLLPFLRRNSHLKDFALRTGTDRRLIFCCRVISQTGGKNIHEHRIHKVFLGIILVGDRESVFHAGARKGSRCVRVLGDADQRDLYLGNINYRCIACTQGLRSLLRSRFIPLLIVEFCRGFVSKLCDLSSRMCCTVRIHGAVLNLFHLHINFGGRRLEFFSQRVARCFRHNFRTVIDDFEGLGSLRSKQRRAEHNVRIRPEERTGTIRSIQFTVIEHVRLYCGAVKLQRSGHNLRGITNLDRLDFIIRRGRYTFRKSVVNQLEGLKHLVLAGHIGRKFIYYIALALQQRFDFKLLAGCTDIGSDNSIVRIGSFFHGFLITGNNCLFQTNARGSVDVRKDELFRACRMGNRLNGCIPMYPRVVLHHGVIGLVTEYSCFNQDIAFCGIPAVAQVDGIIGCLAGIVVAFPCDAGTLIPFSTGNIRISLVCYMCGCIPLENDSRKLRKIILVCAGGNQICNAFVIRHKVRSDFNHLEVHPGKYILRIVPDIKLDDGGLQIRYIVSAELNRSGIAIICEYICILDGLFACCRLYRNILQRLLHLILIDAGKPAEGIIIETGFSYCICFEGGQHVLSVKDDLAFSSHDGLRGNLHPDIRLCLGIPVVQREVGSTGTRGMNYVRALNVVKLGNLKRITGRVGQVGAIHRITDREVLHVAAIIRLCSSVKLEFHLDISLVRIRVENEVRRCNRLNNTVSGRTCTIQRNKRLIVYIYVRPGVLLDFLHRGAGDLFPGTVHLVLNHKFCTGEEISLVFIIFMEFYQSVEIIVCNIDDKRISGFN